MKKSIFTLVILLLGFNGLLAQSYSGGAGTFIDPWQIYNATDLSYLSTHSLDWDNHFIQTDDINAAPLGNFSPIGKHPPPYFTGSYDGNGHTIDGLYISTSRNCGLFGYIKNGDISNLGVLNVNISAPSFAGGLVGSNIGGTVSNCYSTGSVTGFWYAGGGLIGYNQGGTNTNSYSTCRVNGNDIYAGGLIGDNDGSTITNCYSTGSVTGYDVVGGLSGESSYSTVSNCYSTGSVNGTINIGGLVGRNWGSAITNCYSTGSVTGSNFVGGLVGQNRRNNITNCYSTGSVTGSNNVGGLVGYISRCTVSNSFWDTQTSGQSSSAGGSGAMGKTTAEMQTKSTFTSAGWDFCTIWQIIGTNYPVFKGDTPPLSVNAGSDANIYIGYGNQNAILTASSEGGTGQYSYLWSNYATTQTIIVNPTTTTTYTVTVTDECNNTASDEVMVNVIDVRCGKNNNKVLVCHKGNTICISPNAVQTHLNNHGDYLGNCGGDQLVTLPTEFELHENYPNPFNPTTRIDYSLPFDSKVSLQIFDALGREVVTLVNEYQRAGYYSIDFNASNLASGIYYYRMSAGDFIAIKKMVLLK